MQEGKNRGAVKLISLQKGQRALDPERKQNTHSLSERGQQLRPEVSLCLTQPVPRGLSHSYQSPLEINLFGYLKGVWNPSR